MSIPEMMFAPLVVEGAEYADFPNTPPRIYWVQRIEAQGGWFVYETVQARLDQGVKEDGTGSLIVGVEYRHKSGSYDNAVRAYRALACRPVDAPEILEAA